MRKVLHNQGVGGWRHSDKPPLSVAAIGREQDASCCHEKHRDFQPPEKHVDMFRILYVVPWSTCNCVYIGLSDGARTCVASWIPGDAIGDHQTLRGFRVQPKQWGRTKSILRIKTSYIFPWMIFEDFQSLIRVSYESRTNLVYPSATYDVVQYPTRSLFVLFPLRICRYVPV